MSIDIKYRNPNFGPFLFQSYLEKSLIDFLLNEGLKTKESYNSHLAGQLKNQFLYPKEAQSKFYNDFSPYISAYRNSHNKYHHLKDGVPVEVSYVDLWINFMKSGEFNPSHVHGSDISFVIFLSVPEEIKQEAEKHQGRGSSPGSIIFDYGEQARPKWASNEFSFLPKTGDLFIFPALLKHWVAPFQSDVTRVSVSGNLRITNRNTFPKDYF